MWRLTRNQLRNNWPSLLPLVFFIVVIWINVGLNKLGPENATGDRAFLVLYVFMACQALRVDAKTLRVWRTLPIPRMVLASSLWRLAVLVPFVFTFVVLSIACVVFRGGQAVFEHVLILTVQIGLCMGLIAFFGAITRRNLDLIAQPVSVTSTRRVTLGWMDIVVARRISSRRTRKPTDVALAQLFAIGAGVALFWPLPVTFANLQTSHIVGVALAVYFTWMSYRMRRYLLVPVSPPNVQERTTRSEAAPVFERSLSKVLWAEWLVSAKFGASVVLAMAVLGYVFSLALYSVPSVRDQLDENQVPILLIISATVAVLGQTFTRQARTLRSLPLTGLQCAALLISYPFASAAAAVPCLAVVLWMLHFGPLAEILLLGTAIAAGVCPAFTFLVVRFGAQGIMRVLVFGIMLAAPFSAYLLKITPHSTLILVVPVLGVALGLAGFRGLRSAVQSSSAVYRHKSPAEQFIQL